MPEKPEVITVAKKLEKKILGKKIIDVNILYPKMIDYPDIVTFKKCIKNQTINSITTRGKWIVVELDTDIYYFIYEWKGNSSLETKTMK